MLLKQIQGCWIIGIIILFLCNFIALLFMLLVQGWDVLVQWQLKRLPLVLMCPLR